MLLAVVNHVETTDFFRAGDAFAHYATFIVIALFAAMFLFAAFKYVKR